MALAPPDPWDSARGGLIMAAPLLPDALWERVEPLLPPPEPRRFRSDPHLRSAPATRRSAPPPTASEAARTLAPPPAGPSPPACSAPPWPAGPPGRGYGTCCRRRGPSAAGCLAPRATA